MIQTLTIKNLGRQDYIPVWQQMREFTDSRTADTLDELWLVEHQPVFTQGQAGKPEHVLNAGEIPVIQTDRGGQVTYHGPGQIVAYPLVDINRLKISIRELVCRLERCVINVLVEYQIAAIGKRDAPGVYVNGAKIASIGLRVRRGYSYHGLAFNINMDLEPFNRINPCGFQNLPITMLAEHVSQLDFDRIQSQLVEQFIRVFGYNCRE